jgi:hypothetical protein
VTDGALLECDLSRWEGHPRRCRWCNAGVYGRRTRWCSDGCATEMLENHYWGTARHAAVRRDGGCVRDGCADLRLTVHHRDTPALGRHGQTSCAHHLAGLETLCETHHREADRIARAARAA